MSRQNGDFSQYALRLVENAECLNTVPVVIDFFSGQTVIASNVYTPQGNYWRVHVSPQRPNPFIGVELRSIRKESARYGGGCLSQKLLEGRSLVGEELSRRTSPIFEQVGAPFSLA